MYKVFEARRPFEYGVKAFDNLLKTDELPYSFCLYQEQEMAALHYAGIPMSDCYVAIKDIAKKRAEKVLAYKEKFIAGFSASIISDEGRSEEEALKIAEKLWQIIEDSARYSFNACLDGRTKLRRAGAKGHWEPTIEEMYLIKTFPMYAKQTGHYDLHRKYTRHGYGNALSMEGDGRIRKNRIVDIRPSGEREVFSLETEGGAVIRCTDNHKFPTPNGEKRLDELSVGDTLYIMGSYEINRDKHGLTNGDFEPNIPKKGERGFQTRVDGDSVIFNSYRLECVSKRKGCEKCGKKFDGLKRFELHHVDGDRTNNDPSNYMWLCVSCHKKTEYANGRTKAYEKGISSAAAVIKSITPFGKERTYNVEMADPYHNFVVDSGIVTSNSHSYCVSCDSLYVAWVKAHYPLELYETLLKFYDSRGEKDKMAEAKEEAKRFFGIRFPPLKYGEDNRAMRADDKNNLITASISSIKGFSASIGQRLWDSAQTRPGSFVDVLYDLFGRGIKAKVEPLIKIDYFSEFGNQRELERIYSFWEFFKQGEAKSIKRDVVEGSSIEDIIRKYSSDKRKDGSDAASYTLTDVRSILYECEERILGLGLSDYSVIAKAARYNNTIGYNSFVSGRDEDRATLFIKDVAPVRRKADGKQFGYAVVTRSLGSGIESRFTIFNKEFQQIPLHKGDVIRCLKFRRDSKGYFTMEQYELLNGKAALEL